MNPTPPSWQSSRARASWSRRLRDSPRGAPAGPAGGPSLRPVRWTLRLRADAARWPPCATAGGRCGARACWCGVAGVGTRAAFGFGPARNAFNPPGVTQGLRVARRPAGGAGGALGLRLVPGDRALRLRPDLGALTASRTAFFPLYPLGLRAIASLGVPPVLAGVLLSRAGARARAVRHPPPDDARAWHARAADRRPRRAAPASRSPGGAR